MKETEEQPPKFEEPSPAGTYTARDYLSWKSEELMELIRGKIHKMSPAPTSGHQRVVRTLIVTLDRFFSNRCEIFPSPFDVYLIRPGENWRATKNILQPDLCVICDPDKIIPEGCIGAPDLVVEILSPSTAKKDIGKKRDLYEEYGVKELWLVHPSEGTVLIHVLENGAYRLLPVLVKGQVLQSVAFPDLSFNLDEVFPEND